MDSQIMGTFRNWHFLSAWILLWVWMTTAQQYVVYLEEGPSGVILQLIKKSDEAFSSIQALASKNLNFREGTKKCPPGLAQSSEFISGDHRVPGITFLSHWATFHTRFGTF